MLTVFTHIANEQYIVHPYPCRNKHTSYLFNYSNSVTMYELEYGIHKYLLL